MTDSSWQLTTDELSSTDIADNDILLYCCVCFASATNLASLSLILNFDIIVKIKFRVSEIKMEESFEDLPQDSRAATKHVLVNKISFSSLFINMVKNGH